MALGACTQYGMVTVIVLVYHLQGPKNRKKMFYYEKYGVSRVILMDAGHPFSFITADRIWAQNVNTFIRYHKMLFTPCKYLSFALKVVFTCSLKSNFLSFFIVYTLTMVHGAPLKPPQTLSILMYVRNHVYMLPMLEINIRRRVLVALLCG